MSAEKLGEKELAVSREAERNSVCPLDFAWPLALSADFPEKIAGWRIDLDEGVRLVINIDIAIGALFNLAREGELSLSSRLTQDNDVLAFWPRRNQEQDKQD